MPVVATFRKHIESVERLMNFDRDVLAFAIDTISDLQKRLVQHHKLDNPSLTAERSLAILSGYREHDSLRPRYRTIFNQALVLLVSYFSSSVHDLFRRAVAVALVQDTDSALLREQVKLSFRDLRDAEFQLRELAPDLLLQSKDISFQDMKSIANAFKEYLGVTVERSPLVNDIIVSQGCRHVIVHTGGIVDERLLRQLSGASPRSIKPQLRIGEEVQFTVEEVSEAAAAMLEYVEGVAHSVEAKYGVV
jgi:hypothetical protein